MEFYFNIFWKKGNKETRELVLDRAKEYENCMVSIHETGSGRFKRIEFHSEDAEIMFAEALSLSGDTFKVKFSVKELGFTSWDSKNKSWNRA